MDNKNIEKISKPFIKWAGGKRNIVSELLERMPASYNKYYEPFIGGGALFFSIIPEHGFISDVNSKLILTYLTIKNSPEDLINILDGHIKNHSKEYYYKTRGKHDLKNPVEIAGRFIYLNKTCFNGLYRENKKGEFNVPIGSCKRISVYDKENIMACSDVLQSTSIDASCFNDLNKKNQRPDREDFVYLDPPYHNTFTGYSANLFTEQNQKELRNLCKELDKNKVLFMLSNNDTDFIRELYADFNIDKIDAPRSISCKGNDRKNAHEVIVTNYEHIKI